LLFLFIFQTVKLILTNKGVKLRKRSQTSSKGKEMKEKIFIGIQFIAGLLLVMFGSNTFLQFMPMPEMTPEMGEFMGTLYKTGYIFPISAILEILAGIAFLSNKFASLMAILVMPVMLNALLSHLFLDPSGIGAAVFITFAIIIVMLRHKHRYSEIFKA